MQLSRPVRTTLVCLLVSIPALGSAAQATTSSATPQSSPASAPVPSVATPSLAPVPSKQVQIGDSVRIPLVVNDVPVGTVVEFRLDRAPATARVENGVFRWRPLRADANATYNI